MSADTDPLTARIMLVEGGIGANNLLVNSSATHTVSHIDGITQMPAERIDMCMRRELAERLGVSTGSVEILRASVAQKVEALQAVANRHGWVVTPIEPT